MAREVPGVTLGALLLDLVLLGIVLLDRALGFVVRVVLVDDLVAVALDGPCLPVRTGR